MTSQGPRRVLIAEDEALIRLDLKEMLEEEGYVVVGEAGDGQQAVDLASQVEPDVVILDVKMPVLDGISAAERIVADQIAPVVMLTAFSQRELVERAAEAGAMAYVVKPFGKADLLPAIEVSVSR
ncbi:MAG TPA: response regulator, partial [Mycobacteriales bacterium]|nr:response regulator [Mycobacteriales bacterium]